MRPPGAPWLRKAENLSKKSTQRYRPTKVARARPAIRRNSRRR
jgi:hypothetical protein